MPIIYNLNETSIISKQNEGREFFHQRKLFNPNKIGKKNLIFVLSIEEIFVILIYNKILKDIYDKLELEKIDMAVPKKRTSKMKRNTRKANWKRKGYYAAQKSLSLAKSMLKGKTTSFIYSLETETMEE